MQSLVKLANIYIASKKQANESPNHQLLENIAKYITNMLRVSLVVRFYCLEENQMLRKNLHEFLLLILRQVFGANEGPQTIGFQTSGSSTEANREDIALPYVQLLANFREQIRNIARREKVGEILKLCDRLRDEDLPDLGVKLEDQEGIYVR